MNVLAIGFAFFVIVLSKVILGLLACWLLMPRDDVCPSCDARLLPIQAQPGRQRVYRVLRLQRRWCMECGGELVGRRSRFAVSNAPTQAPEVTARWSQ